MLRGADLPEVHGVRRPIRIAYLVYRFQIGGLERCVARLCNHLDRDAFHPIVLCLECSDQGREWIEREDVAVIEIQKKPHNDLSAIRRLAGVLGEAGVDILHSQNWGTLVEASLARRWAGTPVHVHTEHGQGLHANLGPVKRLFHRWATRWTFARADAVLICAESVRQDIHERSGYPADRLRFVANGVERPRRTEAGRSTALRRDLGVDDDACVLGSVGRLVAVKGYTTAIDATARLVEMGVDGHLVLVGEGPESRQLRRHAAASGLSRRIHLVGRQAQVGDWLRMFDVYINSSRSEAMSLGVLEAMAVGRPLVVTDAGDNASLVDGREPCGIVVPSGDSEAMANAVARLNADRTLRTRLGRQAEQRFVSHYSKEGMVERHAALYNELIRIQCPVERKETVDFRGGSATSRRDR